MKTSKRNNKQSAWKNTPLLFVNKSAQSEVLSSSSGSEKSRMFQHVQRKHLLRKSNSATQSTVIRKEITQIEDRSENCTLLDKDELPPDDSFIHRLDFSQIWGGSIWHEQVVVKFVKRETKIVSQQVDSVELTPFMWTVSLPSLLGRSRTVDFSLLALSGTAVGQRDNNRELINASNQAYGKSLSSLRQTLADKTTTLSDQVICTCLILISFQLFSRSADSEGWAAHASGLSQIIQLRGPSSFQFGIAHKYFLIARSKIIHRALIDQKRTFLAQDNWRTVPWEMSVKSDYERLMDCMSSLPGLCELYTKVDKFSDNGRRTEGLNMFMQECFNLLSRFEYWFDTLPENSKSIVAEMQEASNRPMPTVDSGALSNGIFLGSLKVTAMILKYWACLIEIYLLLHSASTSFTHECDGRLLCKKLGCENESEEYIDPSRMAVALASQICKSAQHCVQTELRQVGQHYVSFPLGKAMKAFRVRMPETSEELRWCEALIGTSVKE